VSRTSVVFDAGALIACERGHPLPAQYLLLAARGALEVVTSAAVVAQVWRGGARQARLARLLRSELMEEVPLDSVASRRIGVLAGTNRVADVVDGHVALIAGDRDAVVVTSDPDDLLCWGVQEDRLVLC
jgi:predicted nucleic acid-binding protein